MTDDAGAKTGCVRSGRRCLVSDPGPEIPPPVPYFSAEPKVGRSGDPGTSNAPSRRAVGPAPRAVGDALAPERDAA